MAPTRRNLLWAASVLFVWIGAVSGSRHATIAHRLILPPNECVHMEFVVPRGRFEATLDVSELPAQCAATESLSGVTRFYSDKSCLYYDEALMDSTNPDGCVQPAGPEDICLNWDEVAAPYGGNFSVSEHHCSDVTYLVGFQSSCPLEVEVKLLIQMSDLTEETREFCKAIWDSQRGLNELFYLVISMMIGLPLMLIIVGATCCCCFLCPKCPGHKIVNKDPAIVPMGYRLISQKSTASVSSVILVPSGDTSPETPVEEP